MYCANQTHYENASGHHPVKEEDKHSKITELRQLFEIAIKCITTLYTYQK